MIAIRYTPNGPLEAALAMALVRCVDELGRLSGESGYKDTFRRVVEDDILAADLRGPTEAEVGAFRTEMMIALGDLLDP